MTRISIILSLLVAWLLTFVAVAPASAARCQFVLGFATIQSMMPGTVGACLTDEQYGANGDGLQQTTGPTGAGGLLVWRKLDNWTAFTDGYRSWVNGPSGLQERLNTERFCWEGDASTVATCIGAAPVAAPAPSAGVSFVSVVGTSPGRVASVTVQTAPGASCSIVYVTPRGTVSVAQGLSPKTADASGRVSWAWLIGTRTYSGTGSVTVTCNGVSASAGIGIG